MTLTHHNIQHYLKQKIQVRKVCLFKKRNVSQTPHPHDSSLVDSELTHLAAFITPERQFDMQEATIINNNDEHKLRDNNSLRAICSDVIKRT